MKGKRFIILADDQQWRIAAVEDESVEFQNVDATTNAVKITPEDLAQAVESCLRGAGYEGDAVVLGLPSQWCLSASIDATMLSRRPAREALYYSLEQQLPLSAEDFVADFIRVDRETFLAVCIPLSGVYAVVESLQRRGVVIQTITPTTFLTLQQGMRSGLHVDAAIINVADSQSSTDIIGIMDGKPSWWTLASIDPLEISRHLSVKDAMRPSVPNARSYLTIGCSKEQIALIGRQTNDALWNSPSERASDVIIWAALAGEAILRGAEEPWLELRQDALAAPGSLIAFQRPLLTLFLSSAFSLFFILAGLMWRSHQYGQFEKSSRNDEMSVYSNLFPGKSIPIDVSSRLRSERRRLDALAGNQMPLAGSSADSTLSKVLSAIPQDLRCRILELRIDDEHLLIEGEARSHGDAETIASAISRISGLHAEPPRSEQRGDLGVSFVIVGTYREPIRQSDVTR